MTAFQAAVRPASAASNLPCMPPKPPLLITRIWSPQRACADLLAAGDGGGRMSGSDITYPVRPEELFASTIADLLASVRSVAVGMLSPIPGAGALLARLIPG